MYSVSLPQSSDERRMGWGNSTAESKISYVFGCVGSRCPTCINHYQTQKQAAKRKIRSAVSKDPTLQNKLEKLGIDLDFN